jgi:hypothetical protein
MTVLALGVGLSLLVFLRRSDTAWPLQPLIVSLGLETTLGFFLVTEGVLDKPLVDDELATIIGAVFATLPFLLQAGVIGSRSSSARGPCGGPGRVRIKLVACYGCGRETNTNRTQNVSYALAGSEP